jgi:hypothetical protein
MRSALFWDITQRIVVIPSEQPIGPIFKGQEVQEERDRLVVAKRGQGITTIRCVIPDEFRSQPTIQTVPGAVWPDAVHSEWAPDQLLSFATMLQTGGVIPPFPHLYPWH